VSTADPANPTQPQEQSTAPSQSGAGVVTQVENRQVDTGNEPTTLFEQVEASSFRSRWTDIQAAFQAFLK
jgi:hypothetical protein